MRLSELQAMELLDAILPDNIFTQESKARTIGVYKDTFTKALHGNDDETFYNATRRKTKKAFDVCMDPKRKQVSDSIASAYDWFEAKNPEYSKEFLDVIKEAIGEPIDEKWINISDGKGLKRALQSNLIEMDKICSAIRECVQVETDEEHKARRKREKAAIETTSDEVARQSIQSLEKGTPDNEKPEDARSLTNRKEGQSDKKPPRSRVWQAFIVAIAAFVVGGGLIAVTQSLMKPSLSITTSRVAPYAFSGFYQTSNDLDMQSERSEFDKAFSFLTFLENKSARPAMLDSVSLVIDSLTPIEEPTLLFDSKVVGNKLYAYSVNNGWESSCEINPILYVAPNDSSEKIPLTTIAKQITAPPATVLEPGQVASAGVFDLDLESFRQVADTEGGLGAWQMFLYVGGGDRFDSPSNATAIGVLASDQEGNMFITYGGKGSGPSSYSTELFAIIDVNNRPDSIEFISADSAPRIEDVYRIETILAPTQSCTLTCRLKMTSKNMDLNTEPETMTVTVPVLDDPIGTWTNSRLLDELVEKGATKPDEIQSIANSYRYNPESIKDTAASLPIQKDEVVEEDEFTEQDLELMMKALDEWQKRR